MMKKTKYILLIISIFLFATNTVKAESCDTQDIERLKQIAENVKVSYKYIGNKVGKDKNTFSITFSNLSNEISITHNEAGDFEFGNQSTYTFETPYTVDDYLIYSKTCNIELSDLQIDLSNYNEYAFYNECNNIDGKDLKVCDVNYKNNLTYKQFKSIIEDYKEKHPENIFTKLKSNRKLLITIGASLVGVIVVILIIRKIIIKRKSRLE